MTKDQHSIAEDYFNFKLNKFMLVDGSRYADYLRTGIYQLPAEVADQCGITAPLLSSVSMEKQLVNESSREDQRWHQKLLSHLISHNLHFLHWAARQTD